MAYQWDAKHQAALLAWKCNHKIMPCLASGYACPFIIEGADIVQFKKCAEIAPLDWEKALENYNGRKTADKT